ncbi:20S-pre-rRNA D-site endonuclease nob1 [Lecanosticta acicola]|uniref:20S-pre-rRNA D-site endonuclease NOB1 n=1 Tax=Lecanosticta acicola TaxID=111012 RepID=A0AAI9E7Z4_9PEZI|nr:20S-pre-rRNA D-site endonuclease nob1 [Lecanosticta acicola]
MSQNSSTMDKPIHTIVLDTGAIIKNEPSVSTLLAKAESLFTVPAILSEIKDAATRSRVETTLKPFLHIRTPSPNSIKFVTDFARKTGDLAVLSKPDIQIIALTYELECERNGGDWRLRNVPGQKELNGRAPPTGSSETEPEQDASANPAGGEPRMDGSGPVKDGSANVETESVSELNAKRASTALDERATGKAEPDQDSTESPDDSDSDSEGWITPANLNQKQAEDAGDSTPQAQEQGKMEVAVLTTDFAMQNVIIQINLNLLSPSMYRVKNVKSHVLRCHACFNVTKDMTKQFCPRCGQPSMLKVGCSTDEKGVFKLHLKKNFQVNTRGSRYSVPKPVHGSANGRIQGGGKDGWGHELMLAEDQKEYQNAVRQEKRQKERGLMDEDYLPGILTGDRGKSEGRPRVGAGRNVNSRKR